MFTGFISVSFVLMYIKIYIRTRSVLFLLVTILSQAFFTLVSRHLVAFSFLSAWHSCAN